MANDYLKAQKNSNNNRKRLNLIQVFRGFAAILVLLAHSNLIFNENLNQDFWFEVFNFGGSGVDFFFVLSGFIILYIHQYDIGNKNKLKSFFIKRFTRIYPIYWVILTLKLSASLFFSYSPETKERNFVEIVKAFLLFPQDQNILVSSFLGVSWTLSFEIFFYIMFGLLIGLKPKHSFPIITIWLLGTFGHLIGVFEVPKESLLLQFIFNERNLEFALGCFAAYFLSKYKINYGMALISIGAFFYTLFVINHHYQILQMSPVIAFGIPSMLLVIGSTSLEINKPIKVNEVLIYIGNASYSIYLMHGFAIKNIAKIFRKIVPDITQNVLLSNSLGVIIVVMALMVGCAVYSYIEKPLLSIVNTKKIATN